MPDFLSSLVHELRTPLTALRGAVSLLGASLPEDQDETRAFADIAARNSTRLAGLLDDLAVYARLRLPEARPAEAIVDLGLLLEHVAGRVQAAAEARGVTVHVTLPEFDVRADEEMLREAVSRLASYAVRVTPKDGQVRISAEPTGDRAVVRVADEGRPIRADDQPLFFDPFSPVARRGIDSGDRAALDLAIAKIVAERHEGTVEYRQIASGGVVRLTLGHGSLVPQPAPEASHGQGLPDHGESVSQPAPEASHGQGLPDHGDSVPLPAPEASS